MCQIEKAFTTLDRMPHAATVFDVAKTDTLTTSVAVRLTERDLETIEMLVKREVGIMAAGVGAAGQRGTVIRGLIRAEREKMDSEATVAAQTLASGEK